MNRRTLLKVAGFGAGLVLLGSRGQAQMMAQAAQRFLSTLGSRFGWAGLLEPRRAQYYRFQSPSYLLEFDNSRNEGTHIHSVWRDFARDFAVL